MTIASLESGWNVGKAFAIADDKESLVTKRVRPREAKYRCKHCKKVVLQRSTKQWIKSWCDETEQYVRLMRVKPRRRK